MAVGLIMVPWIFHGLILAKKDYMKYKGKKAICGKLSCMYQTNHQIFVKVAIEKP